MRGFTKACAGGKAIVAAMFILLSGCYVRASRPVTSEPAARCPDFSGDYFFPGVDAAAELCPILDSDLRKRLRWPGPSGGFSSWQSKAIFSVRQQGCSSIEFRLLVPGAKPGALTARRTLVRHYRRQHIEWGNDSLTYQDRIKAAPSAFFLPLPVNVAKETIFLRHEPSGALTYQASYWEMSEGRKRVLTECTLPRAGPEDWRAVGLDNPYSPSSGGSQC